jgi:hypothetical protein
MDLHEARELRKELESVEAAMLRIKALWQELPTADDLDALGQAVTDIHATMAAIKEMGTPGPDVVTG